MAERQRGFSYHKVVLYKSQSLGSGSYGQVCKAQCDGLPCAAKVVYPTLFDMHDPGTASNLRAFEEECRLLSLAKHPNLVLYLATYRDPETHLPVLLMELCDESLCRFLERSVGPLPYHTELNISHDIALALVYLHTNGLIHGNLTGNNVLIISGARAKVTDFGIPKLASVNPRMTPLTLCPSSVHYMPPQAFQEPPSYTDKLDTFSFGVLLIQIMTKQFPSPGPHFSDDPTKGLISEIQRRNGHLHLINGTHPLKSIALKCLKDKEKKRLSSHQFSSALSELKRAPEYAQSMQQAQGGEENETSLRKQIEKLKKQNRKQQQENDRKQHTIEQLQAEQKELTVQVYQQQQQQQVLSQMNSSKEEEQRVLQKREKELLQEIKEREQEIEIQQQEIEQIRLKQQEVATQVHELGKQLQQQQVLAKTKTAEHQQFQHAEKEKRKKLQKQVKEFQQEIEQKQLENKQLQLEIEKREQEIKHQKQQSQRVQMELQQVMEKVHQLGQQLREQHLVTQTTTVKCQQLQIAVREKERIIQQKNHSIQKKDRQLNESRQLLAQLQQGMEQKDRTTGLLQAPISARGDSGQHVEMTGSGQTSPLPVEVELPQMAAFSEAKRNIAKLRLEEGTPALQRMDRGSVVVDGSTVYVNPDGSNKLYSCQMTSGEQRWSSLPDSHYHLFSLAVVDGLLTSIGGHTGGYGSTHSNSLVSLTEDGGDSVWFEVFPPMPTARSDTASVTTEEALVVAGGWDGKKNLVTVEVMNIQSKQWNTAQCLPHPFGVITGVICQDQLYLGGGFIEMGQASKSILSCSLNDLLQPQSLGAKLHSLSLSNTPEIWQEVKQLPVTRSTLTTLGGHLLAIGGKDDSDHPTADIHCYDPQANSWLVITTMKTKRFFCLTAVLPEDQIFIVGGRKGPSSLTDNVEIGSLMD